VNPLPIPMSTEQDARNRAARSFIQGMLVDITVALVVAVAPLILGQGFTWEARWWAAVGLLAAKSVVQSAVSYLARKLVPPPSAPPEPPR
jgi:hypothetical protein